LINSANASEVLPENTTSEVVATANTIAATSTSLSRFHLDKLVEVESLNAGI